MGAVQEPIEKLLHQLTKISNEPLDADQSIYRTCKQQLLRHRLKDTLYEVLCEQKQKTALSVITSEDECTDDPQTVRLDNMLIAEGIVDPENEGRDSEAGSSEQAEYVEKLQEIRTAFNRNFRKIEEKSEMFTFHLAELLKEQSNLRPISEKEIQQMVNIIRRKFLFLQVQLKQKTCENVMVLRSRFLDARRKRRNFSKEAIQLLNEYFNANLHNPYPSENVKEELALKCRISVSQVSNWFGNKRIRYKKNLAKRQDSCTVSQLPLVGSTPYGANFGAPSSSSFLNYPNMFQGFAIARQFGNPFNFTNAYNQNMVTPTMTSSLSNLPQM